MGFKKYLAKRIASTVLTFFAIATLIFFLFRQLGDPAALFMAPDMNEAQLREIRRSFGLGKPVYLQYIDYIVSILTLDFGVSIYYLQPVAPIVFNRLLNSLLLTLPALLIAYLGAFIGGVVLAWKRGQDIETFGLATAVTFRSSPRFWVGMILLFVFSGLLGWLPSSGMLSGTLSFDHHWELLLMPNFYKHAILPIISMSLYLMGLPLLLMRTSVLEVIHEDFVDLVRAKGMSETNVMYRHVARNALLPVLTAFGVAIAFSFGGNVLVERVFSYPGVGQLMVNSALRNDYPVAQFSFLMMAAVVLTMNLIVDLLYSYLDPRVSYDE